MSRFHDIDADIIEIQLCELSVVRCGCPQYTCSQSIFVRKRPNTLVVYACNALEWHIKLPELRDSCLRFCWLTDCIELQTL